MKKSTSDVVAPEVVAVQVTRPVRLAPAAGLVMETL
jgi:hypothetical protein